MKIRGSLRIVLIAAGIFLLGSSSGMAKPTYSPSEVTVQALLPVLLKKFAFGYGTVTGAVLNASIPGSFVPGAQVCWQTTCDTANAEGIYTLLNVPSGYQALTASADGFADNTEVVNVVGNTINNQDIAMVPDVALSGLNYRIMTTWDPRTCWPDPNGTDCWDNDLDVHMWMQEISQPINYHIGYYFHYNPYANPPGDEYWLDIGDCRGFPNACLERDARFGFGPETIAIRESELSMYYFGVINFNQGRPGVPPISATSVKVRLYSLAGLLRSYDVPVNGGDKNFWFVFALNGQTGEVTDGNCIIDYTDNPPVCP
jgi:hypothetical protein